MLLKKTKNKKLDFFLMLDESKSIIGPNKVFTHLVPLVHSN